MDGPSANIVGYARISYSDQSEAGQVDAASLGLKHITLR
jgi:hypothetical protein